MSAPDSAFSLNVQRCTAVFSLAYGAAGDASPRLHRAYIAECRTTEMLTQRRVPKEAQRIMMMVSFRCARDHVMSLFPRIGRTPSNRERHITVLKLALRRLLTEFVLAYGKYGAVR